MRSTFGWRRLGMIFGVAGLVFHGGCAAPAATKPGKDDQRPVVQTGFIPKTLQMSNGTERRYVVFVPHNYDPARPWPTILFLHGAGERGDDNAAQVRVGIGPSIRRQQDRFGFITVMPQCARSKWWTAGAEKAYAMAALDRTRQEYNVDPARMYLTGISMGGMGHGHSPWIIRRRGRPSCDLWSGRPARNGQNFAPALLVLPGGKRCDGSRSPAAEHGRRPEEERRQPRYTEYEGVGHNSWDRAYRHGGTLHLDAGQRRK